MKFRIFILFVVSAALIIMSCGDKAPFSPETDELILDEQELSLEKRHHRTFTPWDGLQIDYEQIDEGKEWMSDGILHVRGRIIRDRLETDNVRVTGFLTVDYDYDLNVTTGNGTMTSTWSVDPDEYEGKWEGRSLIKFTNFILAGNGVGRGTGGLKDMKITVTFDETPPPYDEIHEFGYIIEKK